MPQEPRIATRIEFNGFLNYMVQRIQFCGFGDKVDDSSGAFRQHGGPGVHQDQSGKPMAMLEGIIEGIKSAHGMAYQHKLIESEVFHEGFNISTVSIAAVIGVFGPGTLAVSALIKSVAVIPPPERKTHYIPGMRIEGRAVKKDDRPAACRTPVEIVESHSRRCDFAALGEHDLHLNAGDFRGQGEVLQFFGGVNRRHSLKTS